MSATLQIDGLRKLRDRLRQLPPRVRKRTLGTVMRAGATVARREFRKAAPVRTYGGLRPLGGKGRTARRAPGYLKRRGIIYKRQKGRVARYQVGPSTAAFYGNIIEVGQAGRVSARPWLRPAWQRAQRNVLLAIEAAMRKEFEKEARRRG